MTILRDGRTYVFAHLNSTSNFNAIIFCNSQYFPKETSKIFEAQIKLLIKPLQLGIGVSISS